MRISDLPLFVRPGGRMVAQRQNKVVGLIYLSLLLHLLWGGILIL